MKYYIGLDIGTSSVGWAVTDERYHILRKKGKDLWGVRLFEEAQTAAERRGFRTARRRRNREKARIAYLKEIFAPAINEKDPGFFQRLDDSKFYMEDKYAQQPFALFADTGYTDVNYHKDYPTIFHLRKDLIESCEPHDVRLVYLAILNMFKHRGHFLNPNLDDGEIGKLSDIMNEFGVLYAECFEKAFPQPEDITQMESVLSDRSLTASAKKDALVEMLHIEKKEKPLIEICKLMCGLKGTLSVVFAETADLFTEENKKFSISFRDGNYEENEATAADMLSEESFELFLMLKQIHDWGVLSSIMTDNGKTYPYLSYAKVASYEKHKHDLKILKDIYRTYLPDHYNDMFRVMKNNNYSAYVGSVNSKEAGDEKQKIRRGADAGDFFANVKKQITGSIEGYSEIPGCVYILDEIARGTFLPKQLTKDNGVIPNQVHRKELKKILENAAAYLPFLSETDEESGLSASERILQLFSFRIPYYVGPLKGTDNSVSWAVRKETGPVYPWNISDKIDEKETSQRFIEKLIRHCTYLSDEKVLPKASLLYEKYMVLNELNNLKIHGEKISVDLKQDIYRDLFRKSGKRVTNRKLLSYLQARGVLDPDETVDALSGYDNELGGFTNTLANYHKFMEVFRVPVLTDRQVQIAEDVIFYSTVYGDSRGYLKEKITELYGDELDKAQIKRILGYRFKDWGNLSREFLTMEGADIATGEIKPFIARMWDENQNLMQLFDQNLYTYGTELEGRTGKIEKTLREVTYEDLTELYISAPVRRMVWQTIRIVREIEKVMGEGPERIFVEMTRSSKNDKKRTVSRKARLQNLYKGCAQSEHYLSEQIDSRQEQEFRAKKLYLYYLQKGKCMYSGENISFDKLFDDGFYDIDHIYPRHYVKDDSLENNLVLVKAELNREKTDVYPISADIRHRQADWWKALKEGGFISSEKYYRLTRSQPFSEDEQIGFINRQLVETGQGTKAVAEILTQVFSDGKANDKVVYVKAGNVADFRKHYDFLKCRTVNDFHHANDAYLNIVVGNTYFTKYTRNARNFFANGTAQSYHMGTEQLFKNRVERGSILAWDMNTDMPVVKQMMAKNTPIVTRRSYEVRGGFSDQQIVNAEAIKKAKGKGYAPIKSSDDRLADTMKYGGYSKISGSYFFLVEHTKKKKTVRTVENIPVYLAEKYKGKEGLERYCTEVLGLENPSVRWEKIRMYSLFKVNGFPVYVTGRSNDRLFLCNAVQLCLQPEYTKYIREVVRTAERKFSEEDLINEQNRPETITEEKNLALYDELLQKHVSGIYAKRVNPIGEKLRTGREQFMKLPIDRQCYVLYQILQISQLSGQGVDLQEIGGAKKSGVSMINKNISDLDECKLILQSVTGLYEQEIDLLAV